MLAQCFILFCAILLNCLPLCGADEARKIEKGIYIVTIDGGGLIGLDAYKDMPICGASIEVVMESLNGHPISDIDFYLLDGRRGGKGLDVIEIRRGIIAESIKPNMKLSWKNIRVLGLDLLPEIERSFKRLNEAPR